MFHFRWLLGSSVADDVYLCVCIREETTMRSTATLGPSATRSRVQRKRGSCVNSCSSPDRRCSDHQSCEDPQLSRRHHVCGDEEGPEEEALALETSVGIFGWVSESIK